MKFLLDTDTEKRMNQCYKQQQQLNKYKNQRRQEFKTNLNLITLWIDSNRCISLGKFKQLIRLR